MSLPDDRLTPEEIRQFRLAFNDVRVGRQIFCFLWKVCFVVGGIGGAIAMFANNIMTDWHLWKGH